MANTGLINLVRALPKRPVGYLSLPKGREARQFFWSACSEAHHVR